ncbi:putative nuclear RNA export factor SDE5 [Drosera capensis]
MIQKALFIFSSVISARSREFHVSCRSVLLSNGILHALVLTDIIGVDEDDVSRKARKRLVLKLLDRESIKWTEDEASGTTCIRLDEINPKRLSFSKKEAALS